MQRIYINFLRKECEFFTYNSEHIKQKHTATKLEQSVSEFPLHELISISLLIHRLLFSIIAL